MERKGNFMQTYSGLMYWPLDPLPDEVNILDIAHSLAMQCRYTGHVSKFYSVAEHSVHVSHIVPLNLALCGLMHDATEAYLTDVSRPVKRHLTNYREIEDLNWHVIAEKFELPGVIPDEVHAADAAMLHAERAVLMKPLPKVTTDQWAMGDVCPPARVTIHCWSPTQGEAEFLYRFAELLGCA